MKKILALLLIVCCSGCASVTAYHPQSDALWPLVAQSDVIVTGTMAVPVDHIRSCLASNKHAHAEINVTLWEALKGKTPETFVVRWYTEPRDYAPDPERVIALAGKRVLLFLVDVEDAPVRGYYFAGYTPRALADAAPAQVQEVQNEISAQRQLLAGFSEAFPPAEEPFLRKVKSLIDATTRKDSQMAAFRELEELGPKAVPAIIMLMDDRRDLAVPAISLRNPPGHWEAVRHYGPKKVVDAMDAILNQITGHSFGNICSGGTERERQEAVNAWRTYLYHWKKTHNKPTEATSQ